MEFINGIKYNLIMRLVKRITRFQNLLISTAVAGVFSMYLCYYVLFISKGHVYLQELASYDNIVQACVQPRLPLLNKDIVDLLEEADLINCSANKPYREDWVYTKNGLFYISSASEKRFGKIYCNYSAIVFVNDSYETMKQISPMANGSRLLSDAFKVSCESEQGAKYENIHACIAKLTQDKFSSDPNKYNVILFGFDSVSRHMFQRILPKTHEFFINGLGGVLLEGYNIVGDGTPFALMPILTGMHEPEVPEVRKRKPNAKPVDEQVEFIWKRFEKQGYVTSWLEDMANVGTFQYRMTGFKRQPVHHYTRPFYLAAMETYTKFNDLCLGAKPRHKIFYDWLKEVHETNYGRNFFTFGFFSEYSHDIYRKGRLSLTDEDNVKFFKFLEKNNLLQNTFLFVMSDHGSRFGSLRMSETGKLEERMPYFGIYVPIKFRIQYLRKYRQIIENSKRLVVPADIYKTLLEIINESSKNDERKLNRKTYSLFANIPKQRTCKDAGISPHWCACQDLTSVSVDNPDAKSSAEAVIKKINELLNEYADLCHSLTLKRILKVVEMKTNDHVLKFKQTRDKDGWLPDLTDNTTSDHLSYQVTVETYPGQGLFEATVSKYVKFGEFYASDKEISRLNMYGNASKCIFDLNPALRPYCVCKHKYDERHSSVPFETKSSQLIR